MTGIGHKGGAEKHMGQIPPLRPASLQASGEPSLRTIAMV